MAEKFPSDLTQGRCPALVQEDQGGGHPNQGNEREREPMGRFIAVSGQRADDKPTLPQEIPDIGKGQGMRIRFSLQFVEWTWKLVVKTRQQEPIPREEVANVGKDEDEEPMWLNHPGEFMEGIGRMCCGAQSFTKHTEVELAISERESVIKISRDAGRGSKLIVLRRDVRRRDRVARLY